MDIDTMPAGREMDRLIALLMGWHQDPDGVWHTPRIKGVASHGIELPDYSTDIAAAWTVLPELENRVTIYGPGAPYAGDEYRNRGSHWRVEGDIGSVYGETAPLAICRYALKTTDYPG